MKGDDVSVKRASTEVESDASVSKKPKIEDEDDTSMEEESDSDNEGLWSVDAEDDDDGVRSPTINYSNLQDPEPEWDKDSYDGYELEFDPDCREGFSSDKAYAEFREYKTKAFENRVTFWSLFVIQLMKYDSFKLFFNLFVFWFFFLGVFRRSIQIHLPHQRSGRSLDNHD